MKILAHFPFFFFPIQVAYMVQFPFNVITHCSECSCMLCCAPVLIAQHFAVLLLCLLHSTLQCYYAFCTALCSAIVMLTAQHFAVLLLCLLHSILQCYCYTYCTALCSAIVVLIAQHFAVLLLCLLHSTLQCYCYAYCMALCSAIAVTDCCESQCFLPRTLQVATSNVCS